MFRYEADEIDPTRMAEKEGWEDEGAEEDGAGVDYRILSKTL